MRHGWGTYARVEDVPQAPSALVQDDFLGDAGSDVLLRPQAVDAHVGCIRRDADAAHAAQAEDKATYTSAFNRAGVRGKSGRRVRGGVQACTQSVAECESGTSLLLPRVCTVLGHQHHPGDTGAPHQANGHRYAHVRKGLLGRLARIRRGSHGYACVRVPVELFREPAQRATTRG